MIFFINKIDKYFIHFLIELGTGFLDV